MQIAELFPPSCVLPGLDAPDKPALLHALAAQAAPRLGLDPDAVFDALWAREKLGATALGRGVAMPHARLDAAVPPLGLLARLARPLDYEARDEVPVDLVFMVLWPEAEADDFLPTLAVLVHGLRDPGLVRRVRAAATPEATAAALHGLAAPPPNEA